MAEDSLILERTNRSDRVRRVLAAGIRCVLWRQLAERVEKWESEWLAKAYTIDGALRAIEQQRRIRRVGLQGDAERRARVWIVARDGLQRRHGLHQTGEATIGGPRELDELERTLLKQDFNQVYEALKRAQNMTARTSREQVDELGERLERMGPRFRRFVRRADRLWRGQQRTLRVSVLDDDRYHAAVSELSSVYVRIYKRAVDLLPFPDTTRDFHPLS